MVDQEKLVKIANELKDLSPEEQQKKFQELVKDYSPEEQKEIIASLSGGSQECPFCSMVKGKIPVKKVYEDEKLLGILDINPATKGHVILFPKKHSALLSQVNEDLVGEMFKVANKLSEIIFETVGAEGTNIIVSNGQAAGQRSPHVLVNIIPRFKDDEVSIAWQGKSADEKELTKLSKDIFEKAKEIAKKEEPIQREPGNLPREEPRIP